MSRYPLSSPRSLHPDAIEAAVTSLRSGRFTMGETVERFEAAVAAYVGSPHAVMVNSGSSANLLAIEAMVRPSLGKGWPKGADVLVPALSWPTTVWPIVQLGLTPVFVDADPCTLAMDLDKADALLSDRTVGVVLIHVLGRAANLSAVRSWCAMRGLTLLEDCCESFGSRWEGRHVGTVGKIGTFSHYFSHQLTTIEGGTVVTADAEVANDLRSMRSHGWTRQRTDRLDWESQSPIDRRFFFVSSGYNVRPLELQAAIGLEQLHYLDALLAEKRLVTAAVRAQLPDWLSIIGDGPQTAWMNIPLLIREGGPSKARVVDACESHGIETRPIIAGNLLAHPVMYRHWPGRASSTGYPVADRVMRDGFMIGCHGDADVDAVSEACRAV